MLVTELQGGLIAFFQGITKLMTDQGLHLSPFLALCEHLYLHKSRPEDSRTLWVCHNIFYLHSNIYRDTQGQRCKQADVCKALSINTST